MKTKLRFLGFVILPFFLFWAGYQAQGQIVPLDQEQPELDCLATIDPVWLEHAKAQISTERQFDSPIVRVAYLIPSNRTPQPKGVEALQMVVREGYEFFLKQMEYNGLEPKSFNYEKEADGYTPLVHVVNIPETDSEIETGNVWSNKINAAQNAGLSVWQYGEIWILVSESHVQLPNGDIIVGGGLGASGGSADDPGVATMSSDFLTPLANNALTDDRPYHGMIIPEIGPYPLQQGVSFFPHDGSTLSSIASVAIGAFWHELMHALGILPHDFRNDSNFNGNLMGNGFRGVRGTLFPERYPDNYTRLAYVSAHALNYNHYFNSGLIRNQVDELFLIPEGTEIGGGLLSFFISTSDQDGLALLRMTGHPDYNGIEIPLSGTEFDDYIYTPYFEPNVINDYRIIVYDRQGNKREIQESRLMPEANRAPWPFLRFIPPIGDAQESFRLDASLTHDAEGNLPLMFEWDLDFDGVFDTPPSTNSGIHQTFTEGNHLIRVRVTDATGAQTTSTPVALPVIGDTPSMDDITFTLINADTDLPIPPYDPIPEGAELDLFNLPPALNIRANVPDGFQSVRFDLNETTNFRVENVPPYSLFGDQQGDYFPGELSLREHTLSATPFTADNAGGAPGETNTLQFRVTESKGEFVLVDASTDLDLFEIQNEMVIDAKEIEGKELNIRTSHSVGVENLKVRFDLSGPINRTWTEMAFPYALFGDINGDFNGQVLPEGNYILRAFYAFGDEDFDLRHVDLTRRFSIESLRITSFEAQHDKTPDFFEIEEGAVYAAPVNLFAGNMAVWANTNLDAGSVVLSLDGPMSYSRTENVAPYSLFGDINGEFNRRKFPEGDYSLTATPYTGPNGQGMAGESLTISFTVDLIDNYRVFLAGLFDVGSGNMIGEFFYLQEGPIDRSITPTNNANIEATYECDFGDCPGSMLLELQGPINASRIANGKPYRLFENEDGSSMGMDFPVGEYTLYVTPYRGPDGTGIQSETVVFNFEIINSEAGFILNSVGLYDVDAGIEIDELLSLDDGNMININLNSVDNLTILVEYYECGTYPCPGSVLLELSGPISASRIENVTPYSLFGDSGSVINGRSFPLGEYMIKITPFLGPNGTGDRGEIFNLPFTIFDPGGGAGLKAILYPNPTTALVHLDTGETKILAVDVVDMNGRSVMQVPEMRDSKTLDLRALEKGIYIVRMYTEQGTQTKKIIIQ